MTAAANGCWDLSLQGKAALRGGAAFGLAPSGSGQAFAIVSRIARCSLRLLASILGCIFGTGRILPIAGQGFNGRS